jgi:tRNA modification GTPase
MNPSTHQAAVEDTIVALSSAAGLGARAIVRLSGPATVPIICRCFRADSSRFPSRGFHEGRLVLPGLSVPLPAGILLALAPRSFTGQDAAEIHLLGSAPLVNHLVEQLLAHGARAALAGEFALRAFLAGKLDLTQAEAILGVLHAGDADELEQALAQLAGGVVSPLRQLREDLLCLLADLEAGLDFADEDIQFVQRAEVERRLSTAVAQVTEVVTRLGARTVYARPFRVVLAGPPNAGKSSLFNALLGHDTALTSDIPGTTRDYLRAVRRREGVEIELIDTAGTQDPDDAISLQAQELGIRQIEEADLILFCTPADAPLNEEVAAQQLPNSQGGTPGVTDGRWDRALMSRLGQTQVHTKCDLDPGSPSVLSTSAKTGRGLPELWSFLEARAREVRQHQGAPHVARSLHHLQAVAGHLTGARSLISDGQMELIALELRGALDELGELTGAVFTNDLLNRVFSRFCIGK